MGTSQEKPQGMEEEDERFTGDLCCFGVAAGDQRGYAEHLKGRCLTWATESGHSYHRRHEWKSAQRL